MDFSSPISGPAFKLIPNVELYPFLTLPDCLNTRNFFKTANNIFENINIKVSLSNSKIYVQINN